MNLENLVPALASSRRRSACEAVILSRQEKRLLKKFKSGQRVPLEYSKAAALLALELIEPCADDPDVYVASDFYWVYCEYQRAKYRDLLLSSFWLPVLVSILTNLAIDLAIDAPQWLLPLILQWFSTRP